MNVVERIARTAGEHGAEVRERRAGELPPTRLVLEGHVTSWHARPRSVLSEEYPLERCYRDARTMAILDGTTGIQQLVVGRELTGEAVYE